MNQIPTSRDFAFVREKGVTLKWSPIFRKVPSERKLVRGYQISTLASFWRTKKEELRAEMYAGHKKWSRWRTSTRKR